MGLAAVGGAMRGGLALDGGDEVGFEVGAVETMEAVRLRSLGALVEVVADTRAAAIRRQRERPTLELDDVVPVDRVPPKPRPSVPPRHAVTCTPAAARSPR